VDMRTEVRLEASWWVGWRGQLRVWEGDWRRGGASGLDEGLGWRAYARRHDGSLGVEGSARHCGGCGCMIR
jgi:hypothetical protein